MATHGAFYWNELMTTDPVAAAAFFKGLIGYDVSEMPMPDGDGGTYRVLMKDGKPMGGIMGMAPGLPPASRRTGRAIWRSTTWMPASPACASLAATSSASPGTCRGLAASPSSPTRKGPFWA